MDIPVVYEHEGKQYKGQLTYVAGSGMHVWHLMVNGFYLGMLFLNNVSKEWVFHDQQWKMAYLAEFLGMCLVSWYDSFPNELPAGFI